MRERFPQIHSKPIYYRNDGTGRDTYIIVGNGGLNKTMMPSEFKSAFKKSLRQHEND